MRVVGAFTTFNANCYCVRGLGFESYVCQLYAILI